MKGAAVVKEPRWWPAGSVACVRVSLTTLAARPYLGEPEGGAGGRIGVVAAAHSSVGSAGHARGYQELAASLSGRWGLISHGAGQSSSSGCFLFECVQDVVGAARDLARDRQDGGLAGLAARLDAYVQLPIGAALVAGLVRGLDERPAQFR
jgi:hypothetical protein